MAYMSQEHKAQIATELKKAIPKSWKWSLSVRHHSTIVLTIQSAPVDLIEEYTSRNCSEEVRSSCLQQRHLNCNPYHWRDQFQEGSDTGRIFEGVFAALNKGNWDRSEPMTDYFDVGHYVEVHFGRWDKPFEVSTSMKAAA